MENRLEVQLGRLQQRANLAWQAFLAARDISNRWWVTLLWPAESRRARARAEVSAEHSCEYAIALEAQVVQLRQLVKQAEGCLALIGNPRSPEHFDELIAILRKDGIRPVVHHADGTSEVIFE